MYKHICLNPNCGKEFVGRMDALTCSPACRMVRSRMLKRLKTHSIEGLQPHARQKLSEIESVSKRAHRLILEIVKMNGAAIAENAISAAYAAADDCVLAMAQSQRAIS